MQALCARRAMSRLWIALAVLACCLAVAPGADAKSSRRFKGARYAKVSRVCPAPKPGDATCFALARVPVSSSAADQPGVHPFVAAAGAVESGPAGGLTPADMASAYGYDPTVGGTGQTIAIVDAYNDPNIEGDLGEFDTNYGIAPCTKEDGCFTDVSQAGSTTLPEDDTTGWSVEISLDVEMAHSACPNCKILLVEAQSESLEDLATAVGEAVALGATEVSNSYGGPEAAIGAAMEADYRHPGVVIAAATGDSGYYDWTEANQGVPLSKLAQRPNVPASLNSVVAVGGTTLELGGAGKRDSETVWNGDGPFNESYFEYGLAEGATGGGCSRLFTAQLWQQSTPGFAATGCGSKRLAADVSADANPYTGFDIYDSYDCGPECQAFGAGEGWLTIGGTSLSTPLISSLYALAGGSNAVAYPSLTLYGHLENASDLYDVTEGGNGFCDDNGLACEADAEYGVDIDCEGTTACNAAPGFDGPSGVGTPNGLGLFEPLLPTAVLVPPSSLKVGVVASFSSAGSSDPYPGAEPVYTWSWGDGSKSTGLAPAHTYSAPGEYAVTLSISDGYGFESAAATTTVKVTEETAKEPKQEQEAKEAKEREEAAKKKHEEELAKSSVNAGSQGVNGFQAHLAAPVPDAQLASTSLRVSSTGSVTLKISCPAGETSCVGTVTLRTLAAVIAGDARIARARASVLTLASGSFTVPGGNTRTITLHLSAKARALLARAHTLRSRATLLAHDPQGAGHTTLTLITLRAASTHRKG
ncbi:MAG TPA: PKD domain-containing protein [Solirubrobacteraceae bacterium]|jgi:hypothetical protein|nr:PKD domain-containing protein [Solirubrobacteraceae bacterium]